MRHSMRRLAVAIAMLLCLATGNSSDAADLHHAGLVVRHGDGRVIYAYISFPEDSISGIGLLHRSGIALVTIGFGGLGEGVCTIDGEGCPAGECRQRVCQGAGNDAPFWQYFRQDAPGQWKALELGASGAKVRDGDVDAWSWTGHDAGLPSLTLAEVQRLSGAPIDATPVGIPTPAVQTVFPAGVRAPASSNGQDWWVYLAGGGAIVLIGGASSIAIRRSRSLRRTG